MSELVKATNNPIQYTNQDWELIYKVAQDNDLSGLSKKEIMQWMALKASAKGINPIGAYGLIKFQGKLTLFEGKNFCDQIRQLNDISINIEIIKHDEKEIIVKATATKGSRIDVDYAYISIDAEIETAKGKYNKELTPGTLAKVKANALLKAVTVAKERVTKSIAGGGDMSELECMNIPGAELVATPEQINLSNSNQKSLSENHTENQPKPISDLDIKKNKIILIRQMLEELPEEISNDCKVVILDQQGINFDAKLKASEIDDKALADTIAYLEYKKNSLTEEENG